MMTRTGPHASAISCWYSAGSSRPSLRTARLITCQRTSRVRTCAASRIHRLAIHAHGQMGSNQKSTGVGLAVLVDAVLVDEVLVDEVTNALFRAGMGVLSKRSEE